MENSLIESNPVLAQLPPHLRQFIKPQNYDQYSATDQSVWRYVMRQNVAHLTKIAHHSYLDGLHKAGISVDAIPSMYGMNRILKKIGWAAVAVDGFIPPNAFMEFQAYKVLVIAADIRQLEHIEYTPAPDIIHESAGHAPIIANPGYAEYLRRLGAIGAKAILSKYDMELYEAVRKLSILKESPQATDSEIGKAMAEVEELQAQEVELSEMAMVRNLQWWTVEYGLIGEMKTPKIYGAGLLSSIGESQSCLNSAVAKIPYSIEAAYQEFDITRPQPQLYVTPSFAHLMEVLEEFSDSLSVRTGGYKGVQKLIRSGMVGSIELSTGLQISGSFSRMIVDDNNRVVYIETTGPSALAYREKELVGHGTDRYPHGFRSPLGRLKSINLAIEDMGPVDLAAYGFLDGQHLSFKYESGIHVEGRNVTGIRSVEGKLLVIQMVDCSVTYRGEVLYSPDHGVFDMAIGKDVISAFAGSADYNSFPNLYHESTTSAHVENRTTVAQHRTRLHDRVRQIRENGRTDSPALRDIFDEMQDINMSDWLLLLEMDELLDKGEFKQRVRTQLDLISSKAPHLKRLIENGLALQE